MRKGDAIQRLQSLQPFLNRFSYATVGLFGRDEPAVILRVACEAAPDPTMLSGLDQLLAMVDEGNCMTYNDPRRGVSKRVLVGPNGKIEGVRLTGETAARDWLKELIAEGRPATELRAWVLAPADKPPQGGEGRGQIVCNCLNVSAKDIQAGIDAGLDLPGLQQQLKCGTSCGSCVPEIKRMVAR
ncbi:(2Fe-2S)-binding protein [Chitinivorax sp. B]|uniref:(2Fe-2S)-binding protein n=1 Tax=Chitinivorax sp. B TaxID=2502235 RepID=UPI0014857877|nr:(2Fe-2S)-binding protein [Chitinivorax sp. B]